jgi:hypothetical protein
MPRPTTLAHLSKSNSGGVIAWSLLLLGLSIGQLPTAGLASSTGDACRKEICNNAVSECMRADLALNPLARSETEKKQYCGQFFPGCMTRTITPDVDWYSPTTVERFLKCPS